MPTSSIIAMKFTTRYTVHIPYKPRKHQLVRVNTIEISIRPYHAPKILSWLRIAIV